jgi:GNAT superfamily N-acetyltransferase
VLRAPTPADKNFILATWLKGQYWGSTYFRQIPKDEYFRDYPATIISILSTPGAELLIACDRARPEWIVGFSVLKGSALYWIHVRKDYRGKGIGRLLLGGHEIKTVKALTKIGRTIAMKKGLTFNPL